jgi:hypothetical protein
MNKFASVLAQGRKIPPFIHPRHITDSYHCYLTVRDLNSVQTPFCFYTQDINGELIIVGNILFQTGVHTIVEKCFWGEGGVSTAIIFIYKHCFRIDDRFWGLALKIM